MLFRRLFLGSRPIVTHTSVRASASFGRTWELLDQSEKLIEMLGMAYPAFMLTKQGCLPCIKTKKLLRELGVRCQMVHLDGLSKDEKMAMQAFLRATTGAGSVPRLYVAGQCLGGLNDVRRKHWEGELMPALVAAGLKSKEAVQPAFAWNPLL
eukprot:TRINITY_DN59427_c0_g1_i1.p1 TRINITY_DN59427_c0_g1~~TRINITY_DN59427_c0_g1_i1.p1  ORF type:complete len:153 (-),score=27.93 TRINITY_DN59427_c0_g1_i1:316-774(-)